MHGWMDKYICPSVKSKIYLSCSIIYFLISFLPGLFCILNKQALGTVTRYMYTRPVP